MINKIFLGKPSSKIEEEIRRRLCSGKVFFHAQDGATVEYNGKIFYPTLFYLKADGRQVDDIFQQNPHLSASQLEFSNYSLSAVKALNIEDKNVKNVRQYAFRYCNNLLSVNLNEVENLEQYCFDQCHQLSLVIAPELKTTEAGALRFTNIEHVDFEKTTDIGHYCFDNCYNLKSVNVPQVTAIGNYCFSMCNNLETITFNEGLEIICANTFYNCSNLKEIDTKNVKTISSNAFVNCQSLTNFDFSNIETIYGNAFTECNGLTTVNLKNVNSIHGTIFNNCANLVSVQVDEMNSNFRLLNEYNQETNAGIMLLNKHDESISWASRLCCENIVLPEYVKKCYFNLNSFSKLKSFNGNSLTSISQQCFQYDRNLTTLYLNNLLSALPSVCESCTQLKDVQLDNLVRIQRKAFANCKNLEYIKLPSLTSFYSITTAANSPFYGCTSLKTIDFGNTMTKPPLLTLTTIFDTLPSSYKIMVPHGTSSVWKNATTWKNSKIAPHIFENDA